MKKYLSLFKILSIFIFLVAFGGTSSANQSGLKIPDQVTGDLAYDHVYYLSEVIGARTAGSAQEEDTADYILEQLERMGYAVEVQEFEYERRDTIYSSQNIIAIKPGKNDQTVIIGAHYDSVSERSCDDGNILTGAGDNASGVAVSLK